MQIFRKLSVAAAIAAAMLVGATAHAQERTATNSIFAEGLGPGLAYSLNYEKIIENDFGVRVGISYLSMGASVSGAGGTASASASFLAIPITASYLGVSSGSNALELGAGASIVNVSGSASSMGLSTTGSGTIALGTAMVGYRRQPVDGGFQFRIGVEALFGSGLGGIDSNGQAAFGVIPWGYISMGATF